MRQEFADKLVECGCNRNMLLALMSDIDAEKRSLKSRLSQMSSEPDGEFGRGRERQVKIRKMKDKDSFLTEEREIVRAKLGSLKMDQKSLNRAVSSRSPEFSHAFIAAAERILSEDQLVQIEQRAAEMITANN